MIAATSGGESSRGTIVFASMEFHPTKANAGGAGMFMHRAVEMLVEQGYTVILLFDALRHEYERLVNVDRLGIPFGHRFLVYLVEDLCQDLVLPLRCADIAIEKSLRLDHALRKLTAMHEIDLIEIYDYCGHGFHYLSRPAAERPPVAVRLHSTIELMERVTRAPLHPARVHLYPMERAQLALADVVLLPGQAFYEKQARPLYPALSPDRVLISPPVHQPIGEVDYDPTARNIAFYGRLSTMKGFDTFLRAGLLALQEAAFADWLGQFVLIGPDDVVATALSTEELRASIPPDKVSRFRFTGLLDHAALLQHLRGAAFACFANRMETFCYAAHELHTAGIPLIVNRIPAFEDGFEEGVSATFFDGTALDLAEQMKRLARDAALRSSLSRYGKARAPSYWVDRYTGHLGLLRERRQSADTREPTSGAVVVLSNGDHDAVETTLACLAPLPLRAFVLELDPNGELRFAGSRWRGLDPAGARAAGLERVGDACLFVRAGDVIEAEWAKTALRVLAQNAKVGAVGGWLHRHSGIEAMTYLCIPEVADGDEPGLRVLLRVGHEQTLAEYLNGWSSQSERSYLLANRAAGLVSAELPQLAVDIRGAVELPPIPVAAIAGDYDRFSREFLTLAKPLIGPPSTGRGAPPRLTFELPESDPDVLATTAIPSLVVLRAASISKGELWVLRLLRGDRLSDLDESSVVRSGPWQEVVRPDLRDASARAPVTRSGSMRFHALERTGVDLLFGPACGVCEIVHRGLVHQIDLQQPELRSARLWLDELGGADESRAKQDQQAFLPASALAPAHAALKAQNPQLIAIASASATAGIASMLRFRSGCCLLTPDELQMHGASTSAGGVAYAVRAIQHAAPRQVAIDAAAPGGAALAALLLSGDRDLQLTVLLQEAPAVGVRGALDLYLRFGAWLRLAMKFPARLSVASVSDGPIDLFSHCGVRAFRIPVRLPAMAAVPRCGTGVEVVLLAGLGTVERTHHSAGHRQSNLVHMIAGVAHARSIGLRLDRLWLPAEDVLGAEIAGQFSGVPQIALYAEAAKALQSGDARRVALCVYPDDEELPEAAALALRFGALPVLGPASVFARRPALRQSLAVTYWENAVAIAEALRSTVERYDALVEEYDRLRLEREAMTEAGLSALFAGSPEQREPMLAVAG